MDLAKVMDQVRCREDSDPRYITNAEDVKLRAFTTKVRYRCSTTLHSCSDEHQLYT